MTDLDQLEACFLPMNQRTPPQACFFRIIGRDEGGRFLALLARYREDIHKYFPGFVEQRTADRAYVVFCGGDPAGILLGTVAGQGTLKVTLDYSTPAYRDCSIGAYLYAKLPSRGIHTLVFTGDGSQEHTAYLTKMGFAKENGVYIKHLD